jgi:hypothetical protein
VLPGVRQALNEVAEANRIINEVRGINRVT